MVTLIIVAVVALWLLGGAHAHRRHYRRHGVHPNLYYTYGRGFYGSIKLGGFRIGHRLLWMVMPRKDAEGRREYERSRQDQRNAGERERRRARAEADPEWAEAERAKKREAYRRWRDANPELARQRSREQSRRRRATNPEAARAEVREWHRRKRAADPQWARDAGRRWREANPVRHLENRARQRHGADFNPAEMRNIQGGCCYLCGDPLSEDGRNVNVDHDHSCCPPAKSCSVCRRGLACTRCNTLVGLVGDDPELLRRIAVNLESASRAVRVRIAEKATRA